MQPPKYTPIQVWPSFAKFQSRRMVTDPMPHWLGVLPFGNATFEQRGKHLFVALIVPEDNKDIFLLRLLQLQGGLPLEGATPMHNFSYPKAFRSRQKPTAKGSWGEAGTPMCRARNVLMPEKPWPIAVKQWLFGDMRNHVAQTFTHAK